jgi:triosephosphate isomerase (TIM)
MHKTLDESRALALEIAKGLPAGEEPRVALFPAAVAIEAVASVLRGVTHRKVMIGAQNIHHEKEGAFTGEISASMALSAGAQVVLVGHSERRHVFHEREEWMGKKVARALDTGLVPVLCIGETIEEREGGRTLQVLERQLSSGVAPVGDGAALARIVIAYEPVWAIGTGKTATPAEGEEAHRFIRKKLGEIFASKGESAARAEETLILYGGSVKAQNAADLLVEEDIDGLLVGGASLEAASFLGICRAAA